MTEKQKFIFQLPSGSFADFIYILQDLQTPLMNQVFNNQAPEGAN